MKTWIVSSLGKETIQGEETIQGRKLYEEIRYLVCFCLHWKCEFWIDFCDIKNDAAIVIPLFSTLFG